MAIKKHALLLFSKPPVAGQVKTRLTKEKGGIFSAEQAAYFFRMSMYDVTDLCMQALYNLELASDDAVAKKPDEDLNRYDFFISTCPEDNLEVMRENFESLGKWPREFHYIVDHGSCFDEHFNDAFNQIFDLGYESILCVGGDIPTLPLTHVTSGFEWLHYLAENNDGIGAVMAPCQACGVSLVGWNRKTPLDHTGVYYASNGRPALDAYREKAEELDIPIAILDTVADVDNAEDLAHSTSLMRAIRFCQKTQPDLFVPTRTISWIDDIGLSVVTPPNDDFDSRDDIDV